MRIANLVNDSIVDGHGYRLTVFTQGCTHNCPGCHNPDTHPLDGGREITIEEIVEMAKKNPLLEGVTFSGGEPFLQAGECADAARELRKLGLNIWTYTGYRLEQLQEKNDPDINRLLQETDVLVDGPFLEQEKSYELHFRGSRNQRLISMKETLRQGKIVLWEENEDILKGFTVPPS